VGDLGEGVVSSPRFDFGKIQKSGTPPATFATPATFEGRTGNETRKIAENAGKVATFSVHTSDFGRPRDGATFATEAGFVASVASCRKDGPSRADSDEPSKIWEKAGLKPVFERNVAEVADVAGRLPENQKFADLEDLFLEFEERAALIADGCDISQEEATERAAHEYGFSSASEFYETVRQKTELVGR
jgi:hypothetical protein